MPPQRENLLDISNSSSDNGDEDNFGDDGPRKRPNTKFESSDENDVIGPRVAPNKKIPVGGTRSKPSVRRSPPAPPAPSKVAMPMEVKTGNSVVDNFNHIARDGTSSYKENLFQRSKEKFSECLKIIYTKYDEFMLKKPIKNSDDVVVLKFLYARACTGLDSYEDIISGHKKLNEITDDHNEVKFPAVFLGFALVYQKLNRFLEALDYAKKGVEWFENNLPCSTFSYPGLPADPIEETKKEFLRKTFHELCRDLKNPPPPDDVCKFSDCLNTNKSSHILPSKNIYKSDPDFKPYYQVHCNAQCNVVYHESCWTEVKKLSTHILLGTKIPSEKDFFGKKCLTPDCGGIILKVQIIDSMDFMTRTIEDKRLIEKLEKEALEKKMMRKKEKGVKEVQRQKAPKESKLKKKDKNDNISEKLMVEAATSKNNIKPELGASHLSKNDEMLNALPTTILRKNKDKEEADDVKKKVKKSKSKCVLSLEEFNGADCVPKDGRISRLAKVKNSVENKKDPPASKDLNPRAQIFKPTGSGNMAADILPSDAVKESIRDFVFQQLEKYGPLRESDSRITDYLGTDAWKLISRSEGLIDVLKSDYRMGSYADYICLRGDAENAKKLKEEDDREKLTTEENITVESLGVITRKSKMEELNHEILTRRKSDAGEARDSKEHSILQNNSAKKVDETKDILKTEVKFKAEAAQTDIEGIDIDEVNNGLVLLRNSRVMAEELQETRDALIRIQNERKLEGRHMADSIATLDKEKAALADKVLKLNETLQGREQVFKEASKTQRDLEAERRRTRKLESDLRDLGRELEEERKSTARSLRGQSDRMIEMENMNKNLRIKCLNYDYEVKKKAITEMLRDNESLVEHLSVMLHSGTPEDASNQGLTKALLNLNSYSDTLAASLGDLRRAYEEAWMKRSGVVEVPTEVNFHIGRTGRPNLDSVELETLRLLTTAIYKAPAGPPKLPFSQKSTASPTESPSLGAAALNPSSTPPLAMSGLCNTELTVRTKPQTHSRGDEGLGHVEKLPQDVGSTRLAPLSSSRVAKKSDQPPSINLSGKLPPSLAAAAAGLSPSSLATAGAGPGQVGKLPQDVGSTRLAKSPTSMAGDSLKVKKNSTQALIEKVRIAY